MLTAFVFAANFLKNGEAPALFVILGSLMIDIMAVFLYLFFFSFLVNSYFSNKREYITKILSIKKDKKDDQGSSQVSG